MGDQLIAVILDESKWLTLSMGMALIAVLLLQLRYRSTMIPTRNRILAAMNLFFGVTISTMAVGHLLAVSTKLLLNTLEGSVAKFYVIGIVLAVPSFFVLFHTRKLLVSSDDDRSRKTVVLNAWLSFTLIALGIPNLPLAVPGLLNIGYQLHSRPVVGWVIVCVALIVNVGLFVGSLIFLASGQSFEQFRGIQ